MKKQTLFERLIIISILSSLILISFSLPCLALNDIISINDKENVFVYDEDNCIDDVSEKNINNLLIQLEEKTSAEFAVISIPSLNNLSIEEYANKLFNDLGIGKSGKDNGVLLIFSKSDNKVRLEIGRGLEGCLNDAKCGRILDNYFVPYREENKYTEATELTVNAVLSVISQEYSIELEGVDNVTIPEEEKGLPTWLIIILIILYVIIYIRSDGAIGGGHYHGSSGGFSSRGGFGGGSSGAGGASR